jgi:rhodanese-related sulfurtransferase
VEVTTAELAEALVAGDVFVLDVRRHEEWTEKRLAGATLIPMDQLPDRVEELPDDQPIYVICAVGGRSARAAEALRRAGYDAINIAGGINKWVEEGRPFESGE